MYVGTKNGVYYLVYGLYIIDLMYRYKYYPISRIS